MRRILPLIALAAMAASSCALITGNPSTPSAPSSLELTQFQSVFMSSYYAERSGAPGGAAVSLGRALTPFAERESLIRPLATVPVNRLTSVAYSSLSPLSFPNYPEPGQATSFTATLNDANGGQAVYAISVTTSFPASDARLSYAEDYYVMDGDGDGNWTIDDPVVEYSGAAWAAAPAARSRMLLTFRDGSTRTETIVSSSQADGKLFDPAAFDIDGSLDMAEAFIPGVAPTVGPLENGVKYSSVVLYYVTPAKSYNFWFWQGSSQQTILGIRYYTEVADSTANAGAGAYTAYTTSFEKTLDTLTTTGGDFVSTMASVYVGSAHDTLAETVLRQRVVYDLDNTGSYSVPAGAGAVTTNVRTRVVNIAGQKDFFLSQMNSDSVQLSSWDESTIYAPEGDVSEILAGDTSASVFTREQQITPAAGTLPFAVTTTDSTGLEELAELYYSVITGAAATPTSYDPADSNLTGTSSYTFDGQQAAGMTIPGTEIPNISQAGSIEAWVYIDRYTDTAGIVHKGTEIDFSDECFSLQGWGASGQIAIILNPSSGGDYDIVKSTINLNRRKWYYIVATWDASVDRIYLYINGNLNKSGAMSNTASGVLNNESGILVGSQLPVSHSSAYGYFGLDGKIVGANVSDTAMTGAQVKTKYDHYKGSTSSW